MTKPRAYLCGAMQNLTWDEMNSWREEAERLIKDDFIVINPCRFYNFDMLKGKTQQQIERINHEAKQFDLWAVRRSDIILVNLNYPDSTGTSIEIHMAKVWGIPVVAFGGKDKEVHPWMKNSVSVWCDTLEDAVEHIYKFYYPVLCGSN